MPGDGGAKGSSPARTVSRVTGGKYITKAGTVSKVNRVGKAARKKLQYAAARKVSKVNKTKRATVRMARQKMFEQ